MATTWLFSPDMFTTGTLSAVGAVDGDLFADGDKGSIVTPAFGGRSGANALKIEGSGGPRVVLKNGPQNTVFVHAAFYTAALPGGDDRIRICFADSGNTTLGYFMIGSTGLAHVENAAGAILASTAVPVLNAGEWTLFEMKIFMSATVGTFELRNENNDILLSAAGLALSNSAIAQVQFRTGNTINNHTFYLSDVWIKDSTGTKNNDFGARRIFARKMTGDAAGNGWAFQARKKLDLGILSLRAASSAIRVSDTAALEIGAGDFTIEGFYRFANRLSVSQSKTLVSKWYDAGGSNSRSWRLRQYETGGVERLAFEISTAGTAGSVVTIHDIPFAPVLNHWYFIDVSRVAGSTLLRIDGVKQGSAAADANAYFDGAANFAVGGESQSGSATAFWDGWADEVRYTVGVGRYTTESAPPIAKFPRDASDPNWNNVQFLAGFDTAIGDESQFGRLVSLNGSPVAEQPNDGDFGFQSIDKTLRDDTFIEAAFLPAKGTVEFTGNPLNNETVTIGNLPVGSTVYKFVVALAAPFDVLIGIDAETSLTNLRAAINQDAGEGTLYGTGTTAHIDVSASDFIGGVIGIEARVPGAGGNIITLASTVTGVLLSGATLAGGIDIPAPSEFSFQPIPSGVTSIGAVSVLTRRALVGAGTANVQFGIRNAAGNLVLGTDHVPPANMAWQLDIMDSDTGGASWSAASLIGARTYNNRTS